MFIVTISFIKNGNIPHKKLPTAPFKQYATTNIITVPTNDAISLNTPDFNPAINATINNIIITISNIVILITPLLFSL